MYSYINYYYNEFLLQIILQFQLGYSTKKSLITKSLQFMLPKDPGVSTYVCMCACKYVCACFVCACFVCACFVCVCVLMYAVYYAHVHVCAFPTEEYWRV